MIHTILHRCACTSLLYHMYMLLSCKLIWSLCMTSFVSCSYIISVIQRKASYCDLWMAQNWLAIVIIIYTNRWLMPPQSRIQTLPRSSLCLQWSYTAQVSSNYHTLCACLMQCVQIKIMCNSLASHWASIIICPLNWPGIQDFLILDSVKLVESLVNHVMWTMHRARATDSYLCLQHRL